MSHTIKFKISYIFNVRNEHQILDLRQKSKFALSTEGEEIDYLHILHVQHDMSFTFINETLLNISNIFIEENVFLYWNIGRCTLHNILFTFILIKFLLGNISYY